MQQFQSAVSLDLLLLWCCFDLTEQDSGEILNRVWKAAGCDHRLTELQAAEDSPVLQEMTLNLGWQLACLSDPLLAPSPVTSKACVHSQITAASMTLRAALLSLTGSENSATQRTLYWLGVVSQCLHKNASYDWIKDFYYAVLKR